MSLTDAFATYLRKPGRASAQEVLVASLGSAGYRLESCLLAGWEGGLQRVEIDLEGVVWSGRTGWVGQQLPTRAVAGDIWMDTCEMSGMLLLPWPPLDGRAPVYPSGTYESLDPRRFAWLALRPTHGWQFGAFLKLARTVRNRVQIRPPLRPLDGRRILTSNETAAVTSLLPEEAAMYATWFGKSVASRVEWVAAAGALEPQELAALWKPPHREWAEWVTDGVYAVVSPDTVDADPFDALDEEQHDLAPDRILYGEFSAPPDVTFRTTVPIQLGLRSGTNRTNTLDVDVRTGISRD